MSQMLGKRCGFFGSKQSALRIQSIFLDKQEDFFMSFQGILGIKAMA